MKILYYTPFSGISGDMNMAALVDLGVDEALLHRAFAGLGLGGDVRVEFTRAQKNGICGTRCEVHCSKNQPHRNLAAVEKILRRATLPDAVTARALALFRRLAEAEAKVHGVQVDKVHFHEVGAVDSIIDIVGAAVCLEALRETETVEQVWSAPPELGSGTVRCAHGVLPVPAPATTEILLRIPTRRGGVAGEATTPTGAAILAEFCDRFTASPELTGLATGCGIGHRDNDDDAPPNLLYVHLAEVATEAAQVRLLCCNVDDMSGEALGHFMQLALAAGARDCSFTAIQMKKNRPAVEIALLCTAADEERFRRLLFTETTTLGIKSFPLTRHQLDRRETRRQTPLGEVRVKEVWFEGRKLREKVEYDDCRRLAEQHALPLSEVWRQLYERGAK